jgi:hypothetical protein
VKIEEVNEGGMVLARYIPGAIAWAEGLNFFSKESEYIQAGSWGYRSGKELLPHIHNNVQRTISHTQELIFVKQGKVEATIYDRKESEVAKIVLVDGDILILLNGGHGYKILEDGTQVLEVKNGPYPGAESDRRRFD